MSAFSNLQLIWSHKDPNKGEKHWIITEQFTWGFLSVLTMLLTIAWRWHKYTHTNTLLVFFFKAQEGSILILWPLYFTFKMDLEDVLNRNFVLVMVQYPASIVGSLALWENLLFSCGKLFAQFFWFLSVKGIWSWCAFETSLFHILMIPHLLSAKFCTLG